MYKEKFNERQTAYRGENNRPDDIDLRELFSYLKRGVNSIGNAIKGVGRLIFRNRAILAAFILAGMLVAYGLFYISKPYYRSSMTLVLAEIRNQFVENQLNRLSIMINEDNFEAVAEDLGITLESARQIKEMNFMNLDQDRVDEDSVLTGSPFEIELALYDNTLFTSIEPALANYLENNRYFSKQKIIKQREMESIIDKLKKDIVAMDSVKEAVAAPRGPVNGFVYGEPIDPAGLFRESIAMYEKQVELEASLERLDNIQIVNGFAPRRKPTGPRLLYYLIFGAATSFLVGLVVAINSERKRK